MSVWLIIIIAIALYFLFKNKNESSNHMSQKEANRRAYYYDQIDDLIKKCFNERTGEFNASLYFNECDALRYCPEEWVQDQLKKELRYVGYRQLGTLKAILENIMDYSELIRRLKEKEPNLILNLCFTCGGGEDKECPISVGIFRNSLYDIIYGRKIVQSQLINEMLSQVNTALEDVRGMY